MDVITVAKIKRKVRAARLERRREEIQLVR